MIFDRIHIYVSKTFHLTLVVLLESFHPYYLLNVKHK